MPRTIIDFAAAPDETAILRLLAVAAALFIIGALITAKITNLFTR